MLPGRPVHLFRLALILAGLLLTGLTLGAAPAYADLRVCNQTADPISVALGYRAERGWQSEGWWVAAPSQCATVFQGNLNSRFFYLFAADDIGGGAWDGSVYMCTRDDSFTIFGVDIKKRSPIKDTFIAELANDWIGYLPDREGHELGGYQTWMGHQSYAEPGTGERIADEVIAMLGELKK